MREGLVLRELEKGDLRPDLFEHFIRFQEVKNVLRRDENGEWTVVDLHERAFTEYWDDEDKREYVEEVLAGCFDCGGFVWGVFDDGRLVGFACLLSEPLGSEKQYLQLSQLHVSADYRGMGAGKELLLAAAKKAKELGAKKVYISAHSAVESQRFYERLGCVDAAEVCEKLVALEPYDRQMEFFV